MYERSLLDLLASPVVKREPCRLVKRARPQILTAAKMPRTTDVARRWGQGVTRSRRSTCAKPTRASVRPRPDLNFKKCIKCVFCTILVFKASKRNCSVRRVGKVILNKELDKNIQYILSSRWRNYETFFQFDSVPLPKS